MEIDLELFEHLDLLISLLKKFQKQLLLMTRNKMMKRKYSIKSLTDVNFRLQDGVP
jgi:hypothetical protein